MSKLINIATGWYNFATSDFRTKAMMQKRLDVCDKCPHKVQLNSIGETIVSAINEKANIYKCSLCDCPLAAKTYAPGEKCPDDRWGIAGT